MQVIQATFGTFHHFHLARELQSRGYLKHIYSTYPWRRLQREGLPHDYVTTFPWMHTPYVVANCFFPQALSHAIDPYIAETFDRWLCHRLSSCDAYVALSGSGRKSGKRAQELGAKYICDRGSSHARYQQQLLSEEYRRWNVPLQPPSKQIIERDETEYENADAITVLSEFARRSFIECGVPSHKLHKMLLGVELDKFHPGIEPPTDAFNVLFAGAASFRKGIPYLLEAFRKLRHPQKRLRIAGSVPNESRPYLKSQNLDHVEFMGSLSQPELANLMSESHVLVLPSVEDGFGMVITQAMACGCPVISSTNTGGPDLYTHSEEGFIVPIRSPESIYEALQELADNPSLREHMSEASLRKVRSFGGWHQYGENYSRFLKALCGYTS